MITMETLEGLRAKMADSHPNAVPLEALMALLRLEAKVDALLARDRDRLEKLASASPTVVLVPKPWTPEPESAAPPVRVPTPAAIAATDAAREDWRTSQKKLRGRR